MPYDPNWELEGLGGTEADFRSFSFEDDADGMRAEEAGEEELSDEEEAEDMEVDLPRPPQSHPPEKDPDVTPRPRLPFPGAVPTGGLPHMEVVLHSSRRRVDFSAPPDDLAGHLDETDLVTSNIIPRPRSKRPEEKTEKAPAAPPPKTHPPVAAPPIPTVTPQPKKRGRPFGWGLDYGSYSTLSAGFPPRSSTPRPKPKKPASEQKQRRRPRRKPAPTARQIYLKLNPQFFAFRCEWENCPAELQNHETLRKHLLIVHGRPSTRSSTATVTPSPPAAAFSSQPAPAPIQPAFSCKWSTCTAVLRTHDSFKAHIEKFHLLPYHWHAGDGPRNTTPSSSSPSTTTTTATTSPPHKLPSYLFNALGEQVTPSVHDQQLETEDDRKKRQARINRVLLLRDRNAPEEPGYTARELDIIAQAVAEKRARQRMGSGVGLWELGCGYWGMLHRGFGCLLSTVTGWGFQAGLMRGRWVLGN
ncbi:hypothetical protein N657DRAFT_475261 [Parathielavia appendiculata]|uniref:C2H2-type domain-containing protein n=1 Tax=Parathielavia appendiculata TaxID=2587402 RepID=A0AAN6Z2L7_9PEZI|nr:hypothetical protein N657DRAFT_475261 [Parathielavia appendiculata]